MSDISYSSEEIQNISQIQHILTEDNNANDYVEYNIARLLWCIGSPILLCVGIVGNSISFLTLQGPILKARVSSLFLRALSVVDTLALLFGLLPVWPIHLVRYDVTAQHDVICKLRNFLFYTFSDNSVWLICAFTFDRLIAVAFPFRKKVICTRRNAYIAIATVCSLSVIKNVEILITRRVMPSTNSSVWKCITPNPSHNYYNSYVRPWVVFTAVTAIPFVFITSCNIFIIYKFYKMQNSQAAVIRKTSLRQNHSDSQVASMTRMCLTVSFTFLLLVSPSIILLIGRPYWTRTPVSKARYMLARSLGNLCQYTNNAINFLLYFGSGHAFRRELQTLTQCSCAKQDATAVEHYVTTCNESACLHRPGVEQGHSTVVAQTCAKEIGSALLHEKPRHL